MGSEPRPRARRALGCRSTAIPAVITKIGSLPTSCLPRRARKPVGWVDFSAIPHRSTQQAHRTASGTARPPAGPRAQHRTWGQATWLMGAGGHRRTTTVLVGACSLTSCDVTAAAHL